MRLGGDPEIFLINRKTKTYKSALGLIGAGKMNPKQLEGLQEGFTIQEDNVAVEFGFPPAATEDEFVFNVRKVVQEGLSKLPGVRFSRASCVMFPETELEHPLAHVFGCEPDFNAWTGEENPRPEPPHAFQRSAGGHVHIETKLDQKLVGRACDLYLGIPSLFLDHGEERRKFYGKAGAIRFKPYGVEYRTLSNFWIFQKPLTRWVWCNTAKALEAVESGMIDEINMLGDEIQAAINNGDKNVANQLMGYFGMPTVARDKLYAN